jgi:hypothetical protein
VLANCGHGCARQARAVTSTGSFATTAEEHLQIMRVRPHRVPPRTRPHELQEPVDQLVTDAITRHTAIADHKLEHDGVLAGAVVDCNFGRGDRLLVVEPEKS